MLSSTPAAGRHIHAFDPSAGNHFRPAFDRTRKAVGLSEGKESYFGGHVTFNLGAFGRGEIKKLKQRLISELEQIRVLRNRIESGDLEAVSVYPTSQVSVTGPQPQHPGHVADPPKSNDKKKKGLGTKRGNPFGAGKDPTPKRPTVELPVMEKMVASMMRRCGQILSKLMKHKFGWVFNTPMDVVGLGLHDYHQIIKHPMDLGTIKMRLNGNGYESPVDFAEDVRLTFKHRTNNFI